MEDEEETLHCEKGAARAAPLCGLFYASRRLLQTSLSSSRFTLLR